MVGFSVIGNLTLFDLDRFGPRKSESLYTFVNNHGDSIQIVRDAPIVDVGSGGYFFVDSLGNRYTGREISVSGKDTLITDKRGYYINGLLRQ